MNLLSSIKTFLIRCIPKGLCFCCLFLFPSFFLKAQVTVSSKSSTPDSAKVISKLSEFSLEDLMNIKVVTASGSEQTITDAPSTIRVITAQQIQERGYEQLEDALRDVEGIDLVHLGGYMPTIIYFRGMYGAENLRTLLLIDGIRENNMVGTNDLAGPAYSLHNVERIEIIWGPASALYGADAFGGVINIITKKGADMNGLHYEKAQGTFNTTEEKVMLGAKKNDFDISFAGSLYSTDGPRYANRDPYYTGAFVDKAWSFYGNIIQTCGKFKTTLSVRAFDTPMSWGNFLNSSTKELGLPSQGFGNAGSIGIISEDIRNEHPSLYEAYSYTSYLQTEFTASSKLSILARAMYRETGISNKSYVYLSIDSTIRNINPTTHDTTYLDSVDAYRVPTIQYSNRMKGELFANYAPAEDQKFYGGIQLYQDNLEIGNRGEILDTNKYVIDGIHITNLYPTLKPRVYRIRNNFGSFLQYVLSTTFLTKTNFTLGARYDVNSDYTNPISPRVAIVNQPNDKTTIKLLYGTAFRAPTETEINSEISNNGSQAVNPERVNTYELNLIYKPTSKVLIQLNGFDNELTDIYVLNSLLGGGFGTKQTLGKASIQGGEVRMDAYPGNRLSAFLNYTYQTGKQTDEKTGISFDIPDLPKMKGNIGITYHATDLFTLCVIGNWVGDRILPQSNPYGADKGYKLDGYFVTNVVLTTKKMFENRVSASVNVRNLFDQNYLDPGMRTADGNLYSTVMEQPGRNVLFKIMIDLF